MKKLTQKRLKELLHYDPETGVFTWVKTVNREVKRGDVAGYINKELGYRLIGICGKCYYASRLAWLYMEGYFPENVADHRDRVRDNDRWDNLRHISRQCNSRNCKLSIKNKSGITGVSWSKRYQKWTANVTILYKSINLGAFNSKLDAAKARWNAEKKHNFPNCNSKSTAYLYLKSHNALV